jgi:hypothetical protein
LITSVEAEAVYRELCVGDESHVRPHPAVNGFLADLVLVYPELSRIPASQTEESAWTQDFDVSSAHVLMFIKWSRANDVWPIVAELAPRHGLVCYNPQGRFVLYPPELQDIPHMRLQMENWTIIDNPTGGQINSSLQTLGERNSFGVLEQTRSKFMQAMFQPPLGFALEYKDDSPAGHYYYPGNDLTLAQVVEAFQSYARGSTEWRFSFKWVRYASGK